MRRIFFLLFFISFSVWSEVEYINAFGLRLGTKLSDIKYEEVGHVMDEDIVASKITPPLPMEGLTHYYIDVSYFLDTQGNKRINSIIGFGKFYSQEACMIRRNEIFEYIRNNHHIYDEPIGDKVETVFMLSGDISLLGSAARIGCIESFFNDGTTFLYLGYKSTPLLPYFDSWFGIKLNEKVANLESLWKKGESQIKNYSVPREMYGIDKVSLIVSPETGVVKGFLAGYKIANKESCETEKLALARKLEDDYSMFMLREKGGSISTLNESFMMSVRCIPKNSEIFLNLAFYEKEYSPFSEKLD